MCIAGTSLTGFKLSACSHLVLLSLLERTLPSPTKRVYTELSFVLEYGGRRKNTPWPAAKWYRGINASPALEMCCEPMDEIGVTVAGH